MSDESVQRRVDAYLRERADRPLGDVELQTSRTLSPFNGAAREAADNLLTKALRALSEGDQERADRLVERAVALGYDRPEEGAFAASAAGMILFNEVIDALEASPEGDSGWLDAATVTLTSAAGWGQAELRHTLVVARAEYEVEPVEGRVIAQALAVVADRGELRDADLTGDELADGVLSILQTTRTYLAALD